jgi:hypothetical protein
VSVAVAAEAGTRTPFAGEASTIVGVTLTIDVPRVIGR